MKLIPAVLVLFITISAAKFSEAQQQNIWIPQGIAALQQSASSKSEFTFDHSMLVLASKLDPDNEDLRRVIAGISGISVHRYHFPASWQYDPEVLNSVNDEYRGAGWKRVMNKRDKSGGPGASDLWVRWDNNAVSNVAILLASSNEVNFIVVSGAISPLDLSHLGGHFGIPKIAGGVVVPATERRQ
ncbi:MAG: hypothetical protein JWQ87_687 [Candidatus Sulfotelmatobacter sp.]|nr:hypothetical protein [Candidatus Sulfotelmatobacter sp.]